MTARSAHFIAAFACAAFYTTIADAQLGKPTEGRPVTANDLVGKKICWDDGGSSMFGASGQFTTKDGKHRVWLVTEPGVVKIWKQLSSIGVITGRQLL